MKIDSSRSGATAVLRLGGRLDREAAEQLSYTLDDLVRYGARSLTVDLATVTYISSAALNVLARWQQELAAVRGSVKITAPPDGLRETLAIVGWDSSTPGGVVSGDLRLSSWQHHAGGSTSGEYEVSTRVGNGSLVCRLHGGPLRLDRAPLLSDCDVVAFPSSSFGLGIGAIGAGYEECRERLGELVAVAGYSVR